MDDGLHEIFVNTVNDDNSPTADLMSCFTRKKVQNPNFPVLSKRVKELKETEGGTGTMCQVMQKYEEIARSEGRQEGRREGLLIGMLTLVRQGLLQVSDAAATAGITQEEFLHLLNAEDGTGA